MGSKRFDTERSEVENLVTYNSTSSPVYIYSPVRIHPAITAPLGLSVNNFFRASLAPGALAQLKFGLLAHAERLTYSYLQYFTG